MTTHSVEKGRNNGWGIREKILMSFGLLLIAAEFVNGEILGRTFHGEFLLAGAALCGVSIASWGDKKEK